MRRKQMDKKIKIALVGLGFGGSFLPIYTDHPDVAEVGIFDLNMELTRKFADTYHIQKVYHSFNEILSDESVDAVHLVTPIPEHAEQTVAVLQAGKHCACTVPMATSMEDVRRITQAVRSCGKNYMLMETTAYTYQLLYVKEMLKSGRMGKIQFMRGTHFQDMSGWPDYWMGLPPFWYGTHALSPLRILADSDITSVYCVGSGSMEEGLVQKYGNPYPVECAVFKFENGMRAEAVRSLFETARTYQEGMFIYGSKASFEWGFADHDAPYETELVEIGAVTMNDLASYSRGRKTPYRQIELPRYYEKLPRELWKYTVASGDYDATNPQLSLKKGAGAGHHGSHPHLVHEFVRSIVENRKPWLDEKLGGNITAACLYAHQSAMEGGKELQIEH